MGNENVSLILNRKRDNMTKKELVDKIRLCNQFLSMVTNQAEAEIYYNLIIQYSEELDNLRFNYESTKQESK